MEFVITYVLVIAVVALAAYLGHGLTERFYVKQSAATKDAIREIIREELNRKLTAVKKPKEPA